MKILITGYYGAGNFGDDIMLEVFLKNVTEKFPNREFSVLKMFDKELGITLPETVNILDFSSFNNKKRIIEFLKIIRNYDYFFWVGGTCFTNEDGDGLFDYMYFAKLFGVKIGYIGVGIGNLTNSNRIYKTNFMINVADIMTFRDERSYLYAKDILENNEIEKLLPEENSEINYSLKYKLIIRLIKIMGGSKKNIYNISKSNKIYLTEDLAYVYFNDYDFKTSEHKNNNEIIVSWRNLVNYEDKEKELSLIEELIGFIKKLMEENKNKKLVVLPLDDRKDVELNKLIYDRLRDELSEEINIEFICNILPREKARILENSYMNVSGRLHGIFISELLNIKTIALSYSIKIDEFLSSIGKAADKMEVNSISTERLMSLYNQNELKPIEKELVKNKIKKSNYNFSIINTFLGE